MQRHLADDGQVLVFINRRGYSPTLACTACGWIAPCRDCDARLTVHLGASRLRCHHCGADAPLPANCPQCGYAVKHVGQGTERVEETLAKLFPDMPIVRLDRDVVRKRGDMEAVVSRIASGEARILVGTQMVTKGHDFPSVTLVVVLNADQGLFSTDFRAPERVAQTIIQVAGRAGRGTKPGEVLIQTEYPEHPLLRSLLEEGYDGFARAALAERAAAHWPPFAHVAALRASATELAPAVEFLRSARQLAGRVRDLEAPGAGAGGDDEARGALPRAVADRGAGTRTAASPADGVGAARRGAEDCRATCAGRSTWIRSICSSHRRCGAGSSQAPSERALLALRIELPRRSIRASMIRRMDGGSAEPACCMPLPRSPDESVAGICHSQPDRQARPAVRVRVHDEAAAIVSIARLEREPDQHALVTLLLARELTIERQRELAARDAAPCSPATTGDDPVGSEEPPRQQHADEQARGHRRPLARAPRRARVLARCARETAATLPRSDFAAGAAPRAGGGFEAVGNGLFQHPRKRAGHSRAQRALLFYVKRERGIARDGRFDLGAARRVQLAVDIGHQGVVVVVQPGSPSATASAARPRARRLVSVPIGTSSTSAASLYDRPSTSTSAIARR